MASLIKLSDGNYYLVTGKKKNIFTKRIIYIIKSRLYNGGGRFSIGDVDINTPAELIGKRIRLKVEIIKDMNDSL